MTLTEWREYQSTHLATPSQRGRVMAECDRLGLDDRAGRLALLARLLGLDELATTRDLTAGEAGRLVRVLSGCATAADLPQPPAPWPSRLAGLARLLVTIGQAATITGRSAPP